MIDKRHRATVNVPDSAMNPRDEWQTDHRLIDCTGIIGRGPNKFEDRKISSGSGVRRIHFGRHRSTPERQHDFTSTIGNDERFYVEQNNVKFLTDVDKRGCQRQFLEWLNLTVTYYEKNASIFGSYTAASEPAADHGQDTCDDQSVG